MTMDLSYRQEQEKLNIRIRAHKEYANFDIEDWIDQFVGRKPRRAILDLGCGNGNHLGLYLRHVGPEGKVTGMDRQDSLIAGARQRYGEIPNLDLRTGSMDDPLPFPDESFDLCFSNFAIYYVHDARQILNELRRVMKPGAEAVLIGPTGNNARELYEYNERLTGQAVDPVTFVRTNRLQNEFLPLAREIFADAQQEIINSCLTFPTRSDFVEYFKATIVYEEGAEKLGRTDQELLDAVGQETSVPLSKEMVALILRRD
jgi:ubiquinone/menaquinone biosynthesis C-methylase UbiE